LPRKMRPVFTFGICANVRKQPVCRPARIRSSTSLSRNHCSLTQRQAEWEPQTFTTTSFCGMSLPARKLANFNWRIPAQESLLQRTAVPLESQLENLKTRPYVSIGYPIWHDWLPARV